MARREQMDDSSRNDLGLTGACACDELKIVAIVLNCFFLGLSQFHARSSLRSSPVAPAAGTTVYPASEGTPSPGSLCTAAIKASHLKVVFVLTPVREIDAHVDCVRHWPACDPVRREPKDDEVGLFLQQGLAKPFEELVPELLLAILLLDLLPEWLVLIGNRLEVVSLQG